MNSTTTTLRPFTLRRVAASLSQFRLIPRVDKYPSVVAFGQTVPGKLTLLVILSLELSFFSRSLAVVLSAVVCLGLITFMPEFRRLILAVAPIVAAIGQSYHNPLLLGLTLAIIVLGLFLYWCALRWPESRFGRRPVLFVLVGFSVLIALACSTRAHLVLSSFLWTAVGITASYVWFIAYLVSDRTSNPATDMGLELTALRPFWTPIDLNTPFPKGAAYLRRIEARNAEQLAISQLKGLKLLAWAIILASFSSLWHGFFHGYLSIPLSADAIKMSVQKIPVAWHVRWESLILGFFESILMMSVAGHQVIGICRVAGFNALRNTYRPLSSITVSEFFNRYYYYFKELLVDFFFYPAFLRYWKGNRKIRMVFATFAAVFFGNAFFHFTRDWQIIRDEGVIGAIMNFEASLVYCLILATGLSVSQLRKRRTRPNTFVRGYLIPAIGVALFYCLLSVLITPERDYLLMDHLRYLASLFFIKL